MGFRCSVLLFFLAIRLCSVSSDSIPPIEVDALTRFKESIYEDPLLALSSWNALDSDPCGWNCVSCSPSKDHVIKLNITDSSMKGFLAPELGQLSHLQELILRGNFLLGTIPKEIGKLNKLKILDLGRNHLSGPIPKELGNLSSIVIINLQSNGLSGKLPSELGNLKYLEEIRLDRNRLRGTLSVSGNSDFPANTNGMYASNSNVTSLCRTSSLKIADFSYNFFVGSIPKCLRHLPRASFQGNCFEIEDPKQRTTQQCENNGAPSVKSNQGSKTKHHTSDHETKHDQNTRPTWLLALEVGTGTMVGVLLLVALISAIYRCNNKSSIIIPWKKSASQKDQIALLIDTDLLRGAAKFSRQELEVACEDFSNIIGSSPDSQVYKGTIKGGPEVAVISLCIKEESWTDYHELYFQKEVADLARLNHENTGKLLGYCRESSPFTRMLVLEYASNGTLYEHLHYGEASQISWKRRMKIVIGIARGLKYLHTELDPPFTISELNSNSVYLTEDFSPKLVDFECWKTILARTERNKVSVNSQGAICMLPNGMEDRHLDLKGNLYSFGILLLEIVSGRPPYCKEKGSLVEWAKEYLEISDVMAYLVDPELKHFEYEDLKVVCEVVCLCIGLDYSKPPPHPSMAELFSMLESRIDLSISAELKASSLAWAELALAS